MLQRVTAPLTGSLALGFYLLVLTLNIAGIDQVAP